MDPDRNIPACTKVSPSRELVPLMRTTLAKAGLPVPATDADVTAAYVALARDRDADLARRADAERASHVARHLEFFVRGCRASLRSAGIDPTGMTDDAVRIAAAELQARQKIEADRRDEIERQQQRRARAERNFAAAHCPALHVAHLDRIDPTACPEWSAVLEAWHANTRSADGFIGGLIGPRGVGKSADRHAFRGGAGGWRDGRKTAMIAPGSAKPQEVGHGRWTGEPLARPGQS